MLQSLFDVLTMIFDDFNEMFSIPVFIYGFKEYKVKKRMGFAESYYRSSKDVYLFKSKTEN